MTVSVAVGIVKNRKDEHLLIRRDNQTYNGLLALLGGKVETDEYIDESIRREIREEAGIDVEVTNFCGNISEHLQKGESVDKHFDIKLFKANPISTDIQSSEEGGVGWYNIEEHKDEIVPSDLKMIEIAETSDYYFNCEIDESYRLRSFESFS